MGQTAQHTETANTKQFQCLGSFARVEVELQRNPDAQKLRHQLLNLRSFKFPGR